MATKEEQAKYRRRVKAAELGEMEMEGWFVPRYWRRTLVAMRLLGSDEIDNPEAVMCALDRVMGGLQKKFNRDV